MQISRTSILAASLVVAVGCSSDRSQQPSSDVAPASAQAVSAAPPHVVVPTAVVPATPMSAAVVPVVAPGSVADLVRRAQERHPTAEAARATRDAALAREQSARAWANPELGFHVGRTHPRQAGIDRDVPYGASLTQRLEWTGKRSARQRAAEAMTAATQSDALTAAGDLEADVRLALLALGVAREEASQAVADARLADQMLAAVEQAHAAGDRDTATWTRAKLEVASAHVRRETAERNADSALAVLRLWCGDDLPEALPLMEALPTSAPPLDQARLEAAAQRDPRLAALTAAMRAADAHAAAERSTRVPDVTVGVFAEREDEKDTIGLSFGIELPTWNQQAGPIAEAEAHRRLAAADVRKRQVEQRLALTAILGDYESARAQAESLQTTVRPLAEETLRLRTLGFANGDFSLTDLLEARRAHLTTNLAALDARRRAAETLVRLGQVVGRFDLTAPAPAPAPASASAPASTTRSPETAP